MRTEMMMELLRAVLTLILLVVVSMRLLKMLMKH